ncbi:dihydrofolate reductase family protein [Microbacterium sp. P04]|uniref:dihydrofolate reductase family protein n=1 Tax=Microbacterium sp. P04 TaxID=3366947 RepID=UPI003746969D
MGRLILEQITSVDGYAEDLEGGMSFVVPDDTGLEDVEQLAVLQSVDAIVLGRRTYELFAAYWPQQTEETESVAGPINALPKHVVSNTLRAAPWGEHAPAIVEPGDGVETVRRVMAQYPGDVIVWGSLTLADTLLESGLVDILRLRIVPALAGGGRGITPASLGLRRLTLTLAHVHPGGQVALEYEVR